MKNELIEMFARDLAAKCDVFVENYKVGDLARFGLDYESLRAINPRLIYGSSSGYGKDGPYRDYPAMDLAMLVAEQKSFPWPGASNVKHPLLATAAIQFNARAYPAIVSGRDVVKGCVYGNDTGTPVKAAAAGNVARADT